MRGEAVPLAAAAVVELVAGQAGLAEPRTARGAIASSAAPPRGRGLSLTIVDRGQAEAGTQVCVVWGEHPGAGTDPDADLGFPRIRATVAPAPHDKHARTQYRRS